MTYAISSRPLHYRPNHKKTQAFCRKNIANYSFLKTNTDIPHKTKNYRPSLTTSGSVCYCFSELLRIVLTVRPSRLLRLLRAGVEP